MKTRCRYRHRTVKRVSQDRMKVPLKRNNSDSLMSGIYLIVFRMNRTSRTDEELRRHDGLIRVNVLLNIEKLLSRRRTGEKDWRSDVRMNTDVTLIPLIQVRFLKSFDRKYAEKESLIHGEGRMNEFHTCNSVSRMERCKTLRWEREEIFRIRYSADIAGSDDGYSLSKLRFALSYEKAQV